MHTAKTPAILILAGFIIVVAGLKAASSILVPFCLAVFISVICTPPLFWLQRKGIPKVFALLLILVAVLVVGLLFGLDWSIAGSFLGLSSRLSRTIIKSHFCFNKLAACEGP